METRPLFQALHALAEDNAAFFGRSGTEAGRRLAAAFGAIREHARRLEPALGHFARLYHRFDLDEATPGNGYRSLVHTACCCLAHVVHKSRYVAAHRRSLFFRGGHNAAELEAYGAALAQLRALLCLAQRLLTHNRPGCLFAHDDDEEEEEKDEEGGRGSAGLSALVLREYSTMHNGCFYGRCLGFQFAPSIRPFLQTIAIGLVSFGENYKRDDTGLGVAAGSLLSSGKLALDPELRGAEFERLTRQLDVHFWKRFWSLTESQLLAAVAAAAAAPVRVCWALTVPPEPLELPLAADPSLTVTVPPPVAHSGPGPLRLRLLSAELRQGQDSAALSALAEGAEGRRGAGGGPAGGRWGGRRPGPPSPALLVHFHGGGFVAQTSRSHEPYLRAWARELGAPVLSVDYALAPEAPFPRALEECFYAYCWALRHCHLLGSTAQRVCLAGDSAGGNLCLTVSLRAAAFGIQRPDGIVAAYPVTMVQAAASPSRLLALLDPLLPLGVLCKCLSAYAGTDEDGDEDGDGTPAPEKLGPGRLLLRDLRRGAAAWLGALRPRRPPEPGRKSVSEAAQEPPAARRKSRVGQEAAGGRGDGGDKDKGDEDGGGFEYPDDFQPLRTTRPPANFALASAAVVKNPYMSPLLAPDAMLRGLPPVHLVACALDPMLDDSVMLARRLRALGRPVTLQVVPDLPHGFLSLAPLCPETRRAAALCTRLIRDVLRPPAPRRDSLAPRRTSLLPAPRRDSLAPRRDGLAPPTHGGGRGGSRRGSPQPGEGRQGDGATHGGGAVVTHSDGAAATHGGGDAPMHGCRDAVTHGSGAAATHGGGDAPMHSSGDAVTHGSGAAATHGGGDAPMHSSGDAVTHGSGAAATHSGGDAPMHSSGDAVTHGSGAAATHGTSNAATHGCGDALPHGGPGVPVPHGGAAGRGAGAQPPPCCGGPQVGGEGGSSRPGGGCARRPSGPAGREVGS
ncbi:hormone-sensitive lipase isoform X1 [Struthio camelus]|uniref:hormone-sensitive lipase isoform X1 n=1 Tax=Struthio camelus TaxID=8801 RepID=UPI0036042073